MSVPIIQSKCGLVLTCLLGQITLFAAPVQAGVEGKSYNVNVNSSLGDNFTACFEFDLNGNLRFLEQEAAYNRTNLGQDKKNWQAVTKPPSPVVTIALNGEVIGDFVPDRRINGNAINSNGTTFTFNGTRLSEPICPINAGALIGPGGPGGSENPFLK